ncbi:Methyltransferase sdnD [Bienertia sinuspersici]
MANAWKRERSLKLLSPNSFFLLLSLPFVLLLLLFSSRPSNLSNTPDFKPSLNPFTSKIPSFDCLKSPQSHPVIANLVEGVKYPFLYSLSDLGNLPDKPHKNIQRILKNKPFKKPDISATVQEVLGKFQAEGRNGIFVDIGANVGMASFAAAVMGFRVLAFEPVFENLQRICDGIHFNRVGDFVTVFEAAASDHFGSITFHKLVGRLDNNAISTAGAKLAFKSNEEIAVEVKTIPLDEVIPDSEPVLLLKIDVQGWEYHVLKGAKRLLSRKGVENDCKQATAKPKCSLYKEEMRCGINFCLSLLSPVELSEKRYKVTII